MFKITLARRRLLPRFCKLPQVALPRVRIDFPQEVKPPWQQVEVDRVLFAKISPQTFVVRVTFEGSGIQAALSRA